MSFFPHNLDATPAAAHRSALLPQAAIAQAQFETIHRLPDGNGRTGRALVHAMLRGRGLTRNVTAPVSAGPLTKTDAYFASLTAYRDGNAAAIVERVAEASFVADDLGVTPQNALRAIAPLTDSGILTEFTGFRRNRMWQSREVLSALDDFAARAGWRAR